MKEIKMKKKKKKNIISVNSQRQWLKYNLVVSKEQNCLQISIRIGGETSTH